MMPVDYSGVLSRFQRLRKLTTEGRNGRPRWVARCPTHEDRNPSLGLWIGRDGQLCCKCFANSKCNFAGIAKAIGTDARDWFPPQEETKRRQLMASAPPVKPVIEATYDYTDQQGNLLYQIVRMKPKTFYARVPNADGGWMNGLDEREKVPYRLHELVTAPADMPIIIVEGEKDAESLRSLNLLSTTNCFGAGKWPFDHGKYLRRRRVVILPDNDPPGQIHAALVAGNALYWGASEVRIVNLPGLPDGGDVTDWLRDGVTATTPAKKKAALIDIIKLMPVYKVESHQTAQTPQARAA